MNINEQAKTESAVPGQDINPGQEGSNNSADRSARSGISDDKGGNVGQQNEVQKSGTNKDPATNSNEKNGNKRRRPRLPLL